LLLPSYSTNLKQVPPLTTTISEPALIQGYVNAYIRSPVQQLLKIAETKPDVTVGVIVGVAVGVEVFVGVIVFVIVGVGVAVLVKVGVIVGV
jgi:uncharacterized protein (DUF2062 family)